MALEVRGFLFTTMQDQYKKVLHQFPRFLNFLTLLVLKFEMQQVPRTFTD